MLIITGEANVFAYFKEIRIRGLDSKGLKGERGRVFSIGFKRLPRIILAYFNSIDIITKAEIENLSTDINYPIKCQPKIFFDSYC